MGDAEGGKRPIANRLVLIAIHLIAGAWVWISAVLFQPGKTGFGQWYASGGIWMHLLVATAVLQVGVGTICGVRQFRRPLPIYPHLVLPLLAVLLGTAGTVMGLHAAGEAIAHASPETQLEMWARAVEIALAPTQLGLLIAAWGAVAAAATSGLYLAARVRFDAPIRPAIVSGAAGALAVAGTAGLALAAIPEGTNGAGPLVGTSILGLVAATTFAALGARGSLAPLAGYDAKRRAASFSMALLGALAAFLWVWALGGAAASFAEGFIYTAMVDAAVESRAATLLVGRVPQGLLGIRAASSVCFIAAAVIAGISLGAARRALGSWLRHRWLELLFVVAGVILLIGAGAWRSSVLANLQSQLTVASARRVPAGVNLPVSHAVPPPGPERVILLRGERLLLDGRPIGRVDVDATLEELLRRLTAGEAGQPPPPAPEPPVGEPPVVEGSETPPAPTDRRVMVALALPRWTPMATATRIGRHLCAAGFDRWQVLVREDRNDPWETKQGRRLRDELGPLGEFVMLLGGANEQALRLDLLCPPPEGQTAAASPVPELWVRFKEGELRVLGPHKPYVLHKIPLRQRDVDRVGLGFALAALKDSYREETRIAIDTSGGRWWQELVSTVDAARLLPEPNGRVLRLFDQPVWVLPAGG